MRALPPETRLVLLTFGAALSVWYLNPALASGKDDVESVRQSEQQQ